MQHSPRLARASTMYSTSLCVCAAGMCVNTDLGVDLRVRRRDSKGWFQSAGLIFDMTVLTSPAKKADLGFTVYKFNKDSGPWAFGQLQDSDSEHIRKR